MFAKYPGDILVCLLLGFIILSILSLGSENHFIGLENFSRRQIFVSKTYFQITLIDSLRHVAKQQLIITKITNALSNEL